MKISGRKKMKLVLGMLITYTMIGALKAITYPYSIDGILLYDVLPSIFFYAFVYIGINGSEKDNIRQKTAGFIGCSIFGFLSSPFSSIFFEDWLSAIRIINLLVLFSILAYLSFSHRYNGKSFSNIFLILAVIYILYDVLLFFIGSFGEVVDSYVTYIVPGLYFVSSLIQPLFGLMLLIFACLPSDRRIYPKQERLKSDSGKTEIEKYLDEMRRK